MPEFDFHVRAYPERNAPRKIRRSWRSPDRSYRPDTLGFCFSGSRLSMGTTGTRNRVGRGERSLGTPSGHSSEFSEHLLRTAEIPVHAHSTEHVDRLGEMCPRLSNLTRGREEMSVTEVAPGQLR